MTKKEKEKYAAFGKEVCDLLKERISGLQMSEDDEDLAQLAVRHKTIKEVKYDPAVHIDFVDEEFQKGDTIYYWGRYACPLR